MHPQMSGRACVHQEREIGPPPGLEFCQRMPAPPGDLMPRSVLLCGASQPRSQLGCGHNGLGNSTLMDMNTRVAFSFERMPILRDTTDEHLSKLLEEIRLENARLQHTNAMLRRSTYSSPVVGTTLSAMLSASVPVDKLKLGSPVNEDGLSMDSTAPSEDGVSMVPSCREDLAHHEEPLIASALSSEYSYGEEFVRDIRIEHSEDGRLYVRWPVDARKLTTKDKQIISPSFELFPGTAFRLMLKPKVVGDRKGQVGFHKARGQGSVDLKFMKGASSAPKFGFQICVGSGTHLAAPRGPVYHDFDNSNVCGLPRNEENWNFRSAVDPTSQMFMVSLEVVPTSA